MVLSVMVTARVAETERELAYVDITADDGRGWRVSSKDWVRNGTTYQALHEGRRAYFDPENKSLSIYAPTAR